MKLLWYRMDIMENPVDTEPDERFLALWLDVDIACPLVEGILQQKLDRRNDMLVTPLDVTLAAHLYKLFEVGEINAAGSFALGRHDRSTETEEFAENLEDVAPGGKDPNRLNVPYLADVFKCPSVKRVGLGKNHGPLFHTDRHDQVF
jgi:hypothetical protein